MKLFAVTLTGADKSEHIPHMVRLSKMYPWVEWGILLSETAMNKDKPRYPGYPFMHQLRTAVERADHTVRLAAHLCGGTTRAFIRSMPDPKFGWLSPWNMTIDDYNFLFNRTQINFNANRYEIGVGEMYSIMTGYHRHFDGDVITQHNDANTWVWETCQQYEINHLTRRAHQVLFDASGGRGQPMSDLPDPIGGVLCGYAGGLNPRNVHRFIDQMKNGLPNGVYWIDMETGIRDDDDQFNLPAIETMLAQIAHVKADLMI